MLWNYVFQGFIDEPDKQWTANELPHIDGGYSVEHIKNIVLQLDKVSIDNTLRDNQIVPCFNTNV